MLLCQTILGYRNQFLWAPEPHAGLRNVDLMGRGSFLLLLNQVLRVKEI